MICTLTARRLKPGAYDEFESFDSALPDEIRNRWPNVYVCRDVTDENVALSFGFFDGSVEQLRDIQAQSGGPPEAVGAMVEEVLLDGSYEVVEEISKS